MPPAQACPVRLLALAPGPGKAGTHPLLMMARSNSANTPIIWNIALPAGAST
jgi:hypothetical protein